MTLCNTVEIDVKTGVVKKEVKNLTLPVPPVVVEAKVNFSDVEKLVAYAKAQGWI